MDAGEIERRWAELKERLAGLPAEDRERALDGFAQVLTVLALPRDGGEPVSLSISLDRASDTAYKSG